MYWYRSLLSSLHALRRAAANEPLPAPIFQDPKKKKSFQYPFSTFFFPSQPMRPLKATATTSQPVLTIQQIKTIFYKIQDIFEIHKEFYDALLPNIQQWDEKVTVGHLFQKLVSLSTRHYAAFYPALIHSISRTVMLCIVMAFLA